MKPVDYRNETFAQLQGRITGMRKSVLDALRRHGPCTTRELAQRSGIDILSVRPRITDLHHLGYAICLDEGGTEGRYRAAAPAEALASYHARRREVCDPQLTLL
jgi:DNA-binding IclR family transcriptional regulator